MIDEIDFRASIVIAFIVFAGKLFNLPDCSGHLEMDLRNLLNNAFCEIMDTSCAALYFSSL